MGVLRDMTHEHEEARRLAEFCSGPPGEMKLIRAGDVMALLALLSKAEQERDEAKKVVEHLRRHGCDWVLEAAKRQLEDALEAGRALEQQRNVAVREVERLRADTQRGAMSRPIIIYRLPNKILYEVDDEQFHVQTIFEDGSCCPGVAQFRDEDEGRARSLGYQGTRDEVCWAMHRDHDLIHTLVGQALGWPWSPTLYAAAHPDTFTLPPGIIPMEERMAFLMARALNEGRQLLDGLCMIDSRRRTESESGNSSA